MQAFRKLGPIDAGRAVAVGAAEGAVGLGARLHAGGITDAGGRNIRCVTVDRCGADLHQGPFDDPRLFSGSGDTVVAAKEEDRCTDTNDNRKRANKSQNTHEWPQYFKTRELYS